MLLVEKVREFLKRPSDYPKVDNVPLDKITKELTNDDGLLAYTNFFDNGSNYYNYNNISQQENAQQQANKIFSYRMISTYPEVQDALEEIINEVIFTPSFKDMIIVDYNGENKKFQDLINEKIEKILKLLNIKKNAYEFVKRTYIDGQMNVHVTYDSNGLKSLKLLDPCYLIFDINKEVYRYIELNYKSIKTVKDIEIEELVHADFGLKDDKNLNLSYLEYALKTANQLKTLEDLLIPMRFSRSISRRVFNIDISDLPNSKAEAFMRKIQEQFKYKKFYNSDTGEVTNQQHITSLVEDYWFGNRNGNRGTTVDTIDETGNLGELGDILYFYKKLYKSMKVPTSRIPFTEENGGVFDYERSDLTNEDIKFFMFVNRVRLIYCEFIKDLLKRELIYTNVIKEDEWEILKYDINLYFSGENLFIERMMLASFSKKLTAFGEARDFAGKILPVEDIYKETFRFNDDEIKDILTRIQKESKNPLYKQFYQVEEEI